MNKDDFRNYLNELDTLSMEVRQTPELAIDTNTLERDELLRRFDLNRTLINLLHVTTVHMVRSDCPDYDTASELWMVHNVQTAASHIRQDMREQHNANIRDLSTRALNLVDRILADINADDARGTTAALAHTA